MFDRDVRRENLARVNAQETRIAKDKIRLHSARGGVDEIASFNDVEHI
jgi:hypothetical protein